MKIKLALAALCVVASGCAGTPRWDEAAFPQQVYYDGSSAPVQAAAQQSK